MCTAVFRNFRMICLLQTCSVLNTQAGQAACVLLTTPAMKYRLHLKFRMPKHRYLLWLVHLLPACVLLPLLVPAQNKLKPSLGLHASLNSSFDFVGPSLQAGADYPLGRGTALSAYLHYFGDRFSRNENGFSMRGRYRNVTAAFMLDQNFSRRPVNTLYMGVGVALQQYKGVYTYSAGTWEENFRGVVPAVRLGYVFPVADKQLLLEANVTGPIVEPDAYMELISLLSLGLRLRF